MYIKFYYVSLVYTFMSLQVFYISFIFNLHLDEKYLKKYIYFTYNNTCLVNFISISLVCSRIFQLNECNTYKISCTFLQGNHFWR